jgi:hypothetical protein
MQSRNLFSFLVWHRGENYGGLKVKTIDTPSLKDVMWDDFY